MWDLWYCPEYRRTLTFSNGEVSAKSKICEYDDSCDNETYSCLAFRIIFEKQKKTPTSLAMEILFLEGTRAKKTMRMRTN
jgi:hypothetical protein